VFPLSRRSLLMGTLAAAGAGVAAACSAAAKSGASAPSPATRRQTAAPTTVRPTPSPSPTGPATEVVNGLRTRQQVALTFHASGDPALGRALLSAAEAGGARLTIFVVGSWLEQNPSMAQRILAGRHELGNHTYTHPNLTVLSATALEAEVTRARDVLRRLTGSGGDYFRPSQMDRATAPVLAAAGEAGYRTSVAYDVDPLDYQDPGSAAVRDRTLAAVRPGSIVSMHLGHQGTIDAMPEILAGLRQRGLQPVTVGQLLRA
jgi:peptidoglycan/xylan/chitin deacetylase (PgdA/CDA1 family)